MNNIKIAKELIKLAKELTAYYDDNNVSKIKEEGYKKHINDVLTKQSQKIKDLHQWCHRNYNPDNNKNDYFNELNEIQTKINNLLTKLK